jgi:ABC-2 type transport system permease protein
MINGLKAYFIVDFTLVYRERVALVLTILLPALMYGFFGMLFGNATYGAHSFYDEYTASFIGLIMLNVALMNVGPVLVIYREMGFFRRLLVTPLDMTAVWLSSITRASVVFLLGFVEMMILGWLMFHQVPTTSVAELGTALVICAFSLFSFGFMLGSFFKSANAAFNAGIFVFQPMLLLSGASIPIDVFPKLIQDIAQLIPMTHVVTILRLAWRGEYFSAQGALHSAVLLAFGIVCALVARKTFRWSST